MSDNPSSKPSSPGPAPDRFAHAESVVTPDDPPLAGETMAEVESETDGRIKAGKLAGKTMPAAIWILAFPVLIQQTMQACVGMVDKMIAGALPGEIVVPAMDGLGVGSYVGWFIGIAMTGLGIGGQALIARAIGGGRLGEAESALGQAMALSLAWGAGVGVLLWFLAPLIGWACGLSDDAIVYLLDYVRTLALSMPACGVMMVGSMCLHGAGETTKPSMIAVGINVVNVVSSWMLSGVDVTISGRTFMNPFDFDLHVVGIAAGSAISYVVGAIATVIVLRAGVKDLRLETAALKPERTMVFRIFRIGAPNFCEGLSMWAVNLFVLAFIGMIAARANGDAGEGLQGAHIIAVQWEAFSFMPGFAIGTAAGALAGQLLGAGNPQQAQRAVVFCTIIGAIVMGLLGVGFVLFGEQLTRLVSREAVHLEHTPRLLAICGYMQIFFAITMVVRQGLRGVGDTKWTFIITTVSSYGVRLPAAYILGVHLGYGLEGVWMALCGEFAVRATLFTARFVHGGWKHLKL